MAALTIGGGLTALFSANPVWTAPFFIVGGYCIFMAVRSKQPEAHVVAPVIVFSEHDLQKMKDRLAYVENVGQIVARDVQVQPIAVGLGTYAFRRIPLLRPGDRVPLDLASAKAKGFDLFSLWDPMKLHHDHWLWMAAKDFPGDFTVPLTIEWIDPSRRRRYEYQTLHVTPDLMVETSTVRVPKVP